MTATLYLPTDDLVEHTPEDCPCGPAELVAKCEGTDRVLGKVRIHHRLDGEPARRPE